MNAPVLPSYAAHLRSLVRVEDVDRIDPKVALQPEQVVAGAVEHLEGGWVGEQRAQQVHVVVHCQRIDHVIGRSRGQLQQACEAQVGAQRMGLHVNGYFRTACQFLLADCANGYQRLDAVKDTVELIKAFNHC